MPTKAFLMGYNTLDLQYAENDVELIQSALKMHGFDISTPRRYTTPKETKAALTSFLDDFLDSCSSADTVLVYFSGHAFAPKGELLLLLSEDLKRLCQGQRTFDPLRQLGCDPPRSL